MKIITAQKVLAANDQIAEANRAKLKAAGVFAVNLLGGPGAGKTTLLEALFSRWEDLGRLAVIEGDLETAADASRIEAAGVRVVQINTLGSCHLDANMVARALAVLDLGGVELLFFENVGNLVCPASYRLGEDLRAVVLSVAEGDDKVAKYPPMFQQADAVIVSKLDLLGYTDFDMARLTTDLRRLAPQAEIHQLSARTGEGVEAFAKWLETKRQC